MLDEKYLQNLDGLSAEDLQGYICLILNLDVGEDAEEDRTTKVLLGSYAICRKRAMSAREEGRIRWAELSERRADEAYAQLPEYAQW